MTLSPPLTLKYDMALPSPLTITLPAVTLGPGDCFNVQAYNVIDVDTGSTEFEFLTVSMSEIDIFTDDRSLIGEYELGIEALVDNGGPTIPDSDFDSFKVVLFDSCSTTQLIEDPELLEIELETIEINALEPEELIRSYISYTDTVSQAFGLENMCGPFTYSLLEPVPEFAAFSLSEDESEFHLTINTADYDEARMYSVYLAV